MVVIFWQISTWKSVCFRFTMELSFWDISIFYLQHMILWRTPSYFVFNQSSVTLIMPGPQMRVRNWKLFFLFLNQNICCGCSKEPSRWDGSFEHPKHMLSLMDKKIIAILRKLYLLNWPYVMPYCKWDRISWNSTPNCDFINTNLLAITHYIFQILFLKLVFHELRPIHLCHQKVMCWRNYASKNVSPVKLSSSINWETRIYLLVWSADNLSKFDSLDPDQARHFLDLN